MKKLLWRILPAGLFLAGLLLSGSFLAKRYFETGINSKINITEALEMNDLKVILDQHKGSLLYVDHSSVNCGACYEEMRDFVPALQKRYESKPIRFIYICSESNYPLKSISNGVLWRKKLAKLKPGGYHYLINKDLSLKIFDQTVKKGSGETAYYPWQFIVDESGVIINSQAL